MKLGELREAARKLGDEHGAAAASWVTDGNTEPETYVKLLRGIEDGDPEVLDALPGSPLSGEYADGMTPQKLYNELGVTEGQLRAWEESDILDALCTSYELAFSEAVERVVLHTCQQQLQG